MFGSDDFPLGPNNQFPRQRISNYGVQIIPPVSMQDTYLSGNNTVSKLPNLEKDFHSSISKVRRRMRHGWAIRRGGLPIIGLFRPRYAPKSSLGQEEEYHGMDYDPIYDRSGGRFDEGETDDSVGRVIPFTNPFVTALVGRIGAKVIRPATETKVSMKDMTGHGRRRAIGYMMGRRVKPVVGSWGWMKGVQNLLAMRRY